MSIWPAQKMEEVAEGIFAVIHGEGEMGVANAAFVVEGKRTLVIDTMTFPEMVHGMAAEIKRHNASVEIVLNTHHHIDHIGGNGVFSDATIVAHPESVKILQQSGFPISLYDRLMPQFRGRFAELKPVAPVPLKEPLLLPYGGELLTFMPAHTAADTAVWFPTSRVLITGDIGFINVTPLAVEGLISTWVEALDTLIALKPATVVPGHGPIGTVTDLVILRDYFTALLQAGRRAVTEKLSLEHALRGFDAGPLAIWREAERHIINLERAMQEARGDIHRHYLADLPVSAQK